MDIIGVLLGAILGILILDIIFSAFLMLLGAKLARIENATFGKSLLASLGSAIVTWLITTVFSILPGIGTIIGFLFGVLLSIFIIKSVYNTRMEKAFLCWIFNIIAKIAAIIIALLTFASALFSIFK